MTPVEPRDAASLIIVRRDADGAAVLMGRRKATASFIPDAYVFPGGAIEPGDNHARAASRLRHDTLARMSRSSDAQHSHVLAMAAVRETVEECGLVVGVPGEVGPATGDGWKGMRALGLAPALDRLDYLGRAITPEKRPKRFHARFFMVRAEDAVGDLGGDGELLDLRWVPVDDTEGLRIIDVTYSHSGAQIDYD
jgi:8-oxo-dGTP pyrophosphatase MutT (NUDIX family)